MSLQTMNMKSKTVEREFLRLMKVFGDNVKARRETLGQAHDRVASAVKISVGRLTRIEAGTEKHLPFTLTVKFALYFQIDVKQILSELPTATKESSSQGEK